MDNGIIDFSNEGGSVEFAEVNGKDLASSTSSATPDFRNVAYPKDSALEGFMALADRCLDVDQCNACNERVHYHFRSRLDLRDVGGSLARLSLNRFGVQFIRNAERVERVERLTTFR